MVNVNQWRQRHFVVQWLQSKETTTKWSFNLKLWNIIILLTLESWLNQFQLSMLDNDSNNSRNSYHMYYVLAYENAKFNVCKMFNSYSTDQQINRVIKRSACFFVCFFNHNSHSCSIQEYFVTHYLSWQPVYLFLWSCSKCQIHHVLQCSTLLYR